MRKLIALLTLLLLAGCGSQTVVRQPALPPTSTMPPTAVALSTGSQLPTATPTRVVSSEVYQPTPTGPKATLALTIPPPRTRTPIPTATLPPAPPPENRCQGRACIEHVVVISIDGLRPDALTATDTPTLDKLRENGAYSPSAQTVVPSVTLIGHASMVSGMTPARHGIDWNSHDPNRGFVNGPTMFSAAHEAGLTTALIAGKPKLEHLAIPGSLDTYLYAGATDDRVMAQALKVVEAGLPHLLLIHLPDIDSIGHSSGWMSGQQLAALSHADTLIGSLIAALEAQERMPHTLLIITSDHGGSGRNHGSDSPEDTTIPWLVAGPGVMPGLTLTGQINVYDTAATALYALDIPIPDNWEGRPIREIFETTTLKQ